MDVIPSQLLPKAPVRADELTFILDQIAFGHHCALLGASNTGKSALLNSLITREAQQLLTAKSTDGAPYLVIFVDCLEAGDGEQALYEVIMRRIVEEFISNSHDVPAAQLSTLSAQEMAECHRSILDSTTELAFRSAFASGLRKLLHAAQCRTILILDEFDDTFRTLPPWPFRQLRAAVNQHDGQIQYVVATSHQLASLRQDDETYEFRELFQITTCTIKPFQPDDVQRFLAYLDDHEPNPPSPQLMAKLSVAAGGHPGLLERIHGLVSQQVVEVAKTASSEKIIETLLQAMPIQKECQRLWDELEPPEQDAIHHLINGKIPPQAPQILKLKGLLSTDTPATLFSPLFAAFLAQEARNGRLAVDSSIPNIPAPDIPAPDIPAPDVPAPLTKQTTSKVHTLENGQIWADGQEITWILASEHQRELVRLLCSRDGAVCTYNEIADHVYGVGEGVSSAAIRELVNRTRKKLPDSGYIINVPGEGYRLKV